LDRLLMVNQTTTNKQAQGGAALSECDALEWLAELADVYEHAQRVYESGLRRGVAKELARLPVPVARYSRMRASANLRNWLGFLSLRMASGAQWEIRQFANAVCEMIREKFPRTHGLFTENR
jgi:thymidylate synthase (FAD)